MYAVMWSEHCSYKSSIATSAALPTEAPWVLVGPGEGAGVIDVGDGLAVALRIESHNHPSAVEPYQGAATGVGGIIRDVFSMGARPIALMDPLRFGPLDDPHTRYLFERVVAGISGYGNAVGVPTVGGEVVFDDCYRENPLVNVLCLGLLPVERLVLAKAEGVGNLAVLLGSSTGPRRHRRRERARVRRVRGGLGGEAPLGAGRRPVRGEAAASRRAWPCSTPGLAVGVQDLGAAGISCAASETAAKTGAGMDVDVARVRRREPGMNAVEVMTSESQERMLAIVTPADLDEVLALLRALGDPRLRHRAGHRHRAVPCVRRAVRRDRRTGREPGAAAGRRPAGCAFGHAAGGVVRPAPIADVPVDSLGDGPVYAPPARGARRPCAARRPPTPPSSSRSRFPAGTDLSGGAARAARHRPTSPTSRRCTASTTTSCS